MIEEESFDALFVNFQYGNHFLVAKIEIIYKLIVEQKLIVNHGGCQFNFKEIQ
jgi:hypothetical protein